VILAKEQRATYEDVIFWYMADPSWTSNGKSYSSNAAYIDIWEYKNGCGIKSNYYLQAHITFQRMI
jgi:hypothetical protein